MGRWLSIACACLMLVATAAVAAPQHKRTAGAAAMRPDDGTLVGLHDLRREGHLTCMVGHTHSGASAGLPSRKAAEVAAMRNWSEFTALEYGDQWGNPNLSANKTMKCSGAGNNYGCEFESRPCRR